MGNGVGLSICRKICQQFGGSISVESEKDKGSTFTFTMKCYKTTATRMKHLNHQHTLQLAHKKTKMCTIISERSQEKSESEFEEEKDGSAVED